MNAPVVGTSARQVVVEGGSRASLSVPENKKSSGFARALQRSALSADVRF